MFFRAVIFFTPKLYHLYLCFFPATLSTPDIYGQKDVLYSKTCSFELFELSTFLSTYITFAKMDNKPHRYFLLNKPYNMVSQFISSHKVGLLGDLDFDFPEGTHAIGRLDNNSEGLLLLTTNKKITRLLFQGDTPHKRRYLVQINHTLSPESLYQLQHGVAIKIKNGESYTTPPCDVAIVDDPASLYPYTQDSISYGPHCWLIISLTEGKYHQVRKMMMAVKHRCKRLIRLSIEDLHLGNLPPGSVKEINEKDFFKWLRIGSPVHSL
jgi:23S rRNA pseudouridine2457 synthase